MAQPVISPPSIRRSFAVFVIGAAALIALWLPPLPPSLQIPREWMDTLVSLKIFKAGDRKTLHWDYLIIPPLFLYALWITWKTRPSLAECGLTGFHFTRAVRSLIGPTLLAAAVLLVIGLLTNRLNAQSFAWESRFWKRLIPVPAFFQQMAIQLVFHRQLAPWFGTGRKTAVFLAIYFALLHLPNPGLTLGTLFGMYIWARAWQRAPNLYALALSHAFLSALLMETMPKWLLPSVSVGWRFVQKVWLPH